MKKRLFTGIPLSGSLIEFTRNFIDQQLFETKLQFIEKNNLHITLFFASDIETSRIAMLSQQLQNLACGHTSFELTFDTFTYAPNRKPYMIWAKFADNKAFTELSTAISAVFSKKNTFKPTPHITLLRYNPLKFKAIELTQTDQKYHFVVDNFCLYESTLKPTGAEYQILDKFRLNS